jgi:hypothetical protein
MSLAFSKSRLEGKLQDLRHLTEDFGRLIEQAGTLRQDTWSYRDLPFTERCCEKLRTLQSAGKASEALADALTVACEGHSQHQAFLCLDPDLEEGSCCVRFRLRYRTKSIVQEVDDSSHPWIDVESRLESKPPKPSSSRWAASAPPQLRNVNIERQGVSVSLSSNAASVPAPGARYGAGKSSFLGKISFVRSKNNSGLLQQQHRTKSSKRLLHQSRLSVRSQTDRSITEDVMFRSISQTPSGASQGTSTRSSQRQDSPEDVYIINKDFCARLQRLQLPHDQQIFHVGILKSSGNVLAASVDHPSSMQILRKPSTSLSGLLDIARHPQESACEPFLVPYYKRLMLAQKLSRSILLFHHSQWLNQSFASKDVRFEGVAGEGAYNIDKMYIETLFGECEEAAVSLPSARHLVPNPYLFGLGVLLLELGFGSSCDGLRISEDESQANGTPAFFEFFTAKRLSSVASQTLGAKYATIAKKCLQCDFGCGDDLTNPALQEAVYRQVYCELEDMEQGLRKVVGII